MTVPIKHSPRWLVFLIDLFTCFISICLAYFIRFEFRIETFALSSFGFVVIILIFIRATSFVIFRTYAGLIRYTSSKDSIRVFSVVAFGSIVLFITNLFYFHFKGFFLIPNSILVIDFFITTITLIGSRLLVKVFYFNLISNDQEQESVVIYGVEQFASMVKTTLDRDTSTKYKVLAFIDPFNRNEGKKMDGIDIYNVSKLERILKKNKITKLIIAKKSIDPLKKNNLVELCLKYNVKVLTIPDVNTWINGVLSVNQIKSIKIEDLLERQPIVLDKNKIKSEIKDKVVLITGAAGSIGSEIVRQVTKFQPKKIILFDQTETPLYDLELELKETINFFDFEIVIGSTTNPYRVKKVFSTFNPSIVFHAAAYKHVPMMENNPTEAIFNNVYATKLMANYSIEFGVDKFIMISTDKAVNPTNVMGASKRIAEIYIQTLNKENKTRFITTRFGNVLGSNGSVIPRFKKQIENGGPVTITHPDITRFFMTIPEACQLVLEAAVMGKGGEIFIFDMGKSVKIVDLAKKMIKLSGLTLGKDIQINFTGLRPGEKLYEELLNDKESTIPTHHPQIMIAKVIEYSPDILSQIDYLIDNLPSHNNFSLVSLMKDIVPEFESKNSIYEEIDKNRN